MATTADFSWPQVRTSHGQKCGLSRGHGHCTRIGNNVAVAPSKHAFWHPESMPLTRLQVPELKRFGFGAMFPGGFPGGRIPTPGQISDLADLVPVMPIPPVPLLALAGAGAPTAATGPVTPTLARAGVGRALPSPRIPPTLAQAMHTAIASSRGTASFGQPPRIPVTCPPRPQNDREAKVGSIRISSTADTRTLRDSSERRWGIGRDISLRRSW